MNNDEINLTIKLMMGSGKSSAEDILMYVSRTDLAAFKRIIELWEVKCSNGLGYFHPMAFHRIFKTSIHRDDISLIDYLLKNQIFRDLLHLKKDESEWFGDLLRCWTYADSKIKSKATIDYLILDYQLPFNHHYKKITLSYPEYQEIADMFKSRELALKLSKKIPAKEKNEPPRKVVKR